MDIDARIRNLAAAVGGSSVEQHLLRDEVVVVSPHQTQHPGASTPLVVILGVVGKATRVAYFKRFRDQFPLCVHYGHDRIEAPINEVVAWRLASAMGDPWRQMVPASVLRKIGGFGGALVNEVPGEAYANTALDCGNDQVDAAAFWDALIGNQDRNLGNFRYDNTTGQLGLIDHAFSFARPGDLANSSVYLTVRHHAGRAAMSSHEHTAVELLLRSADLLGLRRYLASDRADALEARARAMAAAGQLPGSGVF
ncbi:MAG: hypothetical protein ACR2LK_04760 [Solirubrobacteraceae bacterium]